MILSNICCKVAAGSYFTQRTCSGKRTRITLGDLGPKACNASVFGKLLTVCNLFSREMWSSVEFELVDDGVAEETEGDGRISYGGGEHISSRGSFEVGFLS
jgi:hypothetical protein